jgi:hypothetical protein
MMDVLPKICQYSIPEIKAFIFQKGIGGLTKNRVDFFSSIL